MTPPALHLIYKERALRRGRACRDCWSGVENPRWARAITASRVASRIGCRSCPLQGRKDPCAPLVSVEHEVVAEQVGPNFGDGDRLEPGDRLDTSVDRVTSSESCSSQGAPRTDKIVSIDFSGPNSALAMVELSIPGSDFIDFLSLLKIGGRWRIIAKTHHAGPQG